MSAVSKCVIPASSAARITVNAWSRSTRRPSWLPPSPMRETRTPELPSGTSSIRAAIVLAPEYIRPVIVAFDALVAFARDVLVAAGASPEDALEVAGHLVRADASGRESH